MANISTQYLYTGKGPFDSKMLVKSYNNLLSISQGAYNGMIVAVGLDSEPSNNGIYYLYDSTIKNAMGTPDTTNRDNWKKICEITEIESVISRVTHLESIDYVDKAFLNEQIEELRKELSNSDIQVDSSVKTYDTYVSLPSSGEVDKLYIIVDENRTYRWDVDTSSYIGMGGTGTIDISLINGGNAEY